MTLLAQYQLSVDPTFVQRVTQAAILSATQVQAEDPGTSNHANRIAFALTMLRSAQNFGPLIAQGVASNPAITSASTDSDIEFTVNSLWDAYSGKVAQ